MMTTSLSAIRCFNHATREAAARCLECGRYYCRECVTEHADRVVCATCLASLTTETASKTSILRRLWPAAQLLIGLLTTWLIFYVAGRGLLMLPSEFHEGTIWEESWVQEE